jgi:hypothetical protein
MEKLPHYYFSWIVSSRIRDKCEMLPLETKRGSTRSHPVENSLWKRLRTCRKTDYTMNEPMEHVFVTEIQRVNEIIR